MPWSETRPMDERLRFVVEAERGEEFFRALCARYGVQAKTGYKWLGRFVAEGVAGLAEQSRRPHHSPTATSPASVALVELRGRRAIARGSNGRLTGSAPSINTKRPHEALGGRPPATLYTGSPRPYPAKLPALEYPGHFLVKPVTAAGTFRFKRKVLFIANALKHHAIGLEEVADGVWSIFLGTVLLGRLDERTYVIHG